MADIARLLDTSALLAFIKGEPGRDVVRGALPGAGVSTVTLAETVGVLHRNGTPVQAALAVVTKLGVTFEAFSFDDAVETAGLYVKEADQLGISLADRACLAAAKVRGVPAVTADRNWKQFDAGVEVKLIR